MPDKFDKLPIYRPRYQRWIFGIYESQMNIKDYSQYQGYFNLTSTVSPDSDFPGYFGLGDEFYWTKENKNFNSNFNFAQSKTKLAFALITNCQARNLRIEYIKELQNYMPVDIYGHCGFKCPVQNCREHLAKSYKFVFSFENSICKDYVTEKFFDALKYNIVPVVLGGANYENYVI